MYAWMRWCHWDGSHMYRMSMGAFSCISWGSTWYLNRKTCCEKTCTSSIRILVLPKIEEKSRNLRSSNLTDHGRGRPACVIHLSKNACYMPCLSWWDIFHIYHGITIIVVIIVLDIISISINVTANITNIIIRCEGQWYTMVTHTGPLMEDLCCKLLPAILCRFAFDHPCVHFGRRTLRRDKWGTMIRITFLWCCLGCIISYNAFITEAIINKPSSRI